MKHHFEGWYYKHQANGKSLAIIPGRAGDGAFIQVVTDDRAYNIAYPLSKYHKGNVLRIGDNTFSSSGITLSIRRSELTLEGKIRYAGLTPLCGDIMGPFRFFPMECRHGVVSMKHAIFGTIKLGGNLLDFSGGAGYIESGSGRSFPQGYAWVQCNDFEQDCSVMVSVARIPFCGLRFWGCICVVMLNGREYRLATYRGVKILRCEPGIMELEQGKYRLTIKADTPKGLALAAPRAGAMNRVIREAPACSARFRFTEGDHVLFEGISNGVSYA